MLSAETAKYLSSLRRRHDAKRMICWVPLGGIFWNDELAEAHDLNRFPEDDLAQILRIFGARAKMWAGEPLSEEQVRLWNEVKSQVPEWALFGRKEVTAEDLEAQRGAQQAGDEVFAALLADADKAFVTDEEGLQRFSATFNLKRLEDPSTNVGVGSIWRRLLRRLVK